MRLARPVKSSGADARERIFATSEIKERLTAEYPYKFWPCCSRAAYAPDQRGRRVLAGGSAATGPAR